jgi:hypothetical protein
VGVPIQILEKDVSRKQQNLTQNKAHIQNQIKIKIEQQRIPAN